MQIPEEKPELMHLAVGYDPAKAHAYYLKTRKLHPRKKGSAPVLTTSPMARQPAKANPKLKQQRVAAAHRVTTLQKKLTELNKSLKQAMADAKKAERNAKKAPTASDKSKKAREAKKYRDTHKQELKTKAKETAAKSGGGSTSATSKAASSPAEKVQALKKAIDTVQNALTAAKARQRALG
jgi:chromosome segregation ATPase